MARRLLALLIAAQMIALTADAQSTRARERADDNARFNREERERLDRDDRRAARRFMTDDQFIREAYARGVAEAQLAQVAVKATQNNDIQKIGHRIINEQGRANDDLKKLAESRNITLTRDLSQSDQQIFDRLSKLQGTEFEQAYRDHLKTDYKQTVQLFHDASRYAQDAAVRTTANQYANLFSEHAQVIGITGIDQSSDRYVTRESDRGLVRERESNRSVTSGPMAQKDEEFLRRAYRMSRTEVQAARLALKNSRDKDMHAMAQKVINDHRQMEQDMTDLASKRGVNLPRQLGEGQEETVDKLRDLSGNAFDKEYHSYVLSSHQKALQVFNEGTASNDPDVRAFATKYADSIREHLRQAQRTGDGGRNNRDNRVR